MSSQDWKTDHAMLLLRTDKGLEVESYRDILVEDIDQKLIDYEAEWYLEFDDQTGVLKLTWVGMDIYNALVIELLRYL